MRKDLTSIFQDSYFSLKLEYKITCRAFLNSDVIINLVNRMLNTLSLHIHTHTQDIKEWWWDIVWLRDVEQPRTREVGRLPNLWKIYYVLDNLHRLFFLIFTINISGSFFTEDTEIKWKYLVLSLFPFLVSSSYICFSNGLILIIVFCFKIIIPT